MVVEFKGSRTRIEDALRSGKPKTTTDKKTTEKVHEIVMNDHQVKLKEITKKIDISYNRGYFILH